MKKSSIVLTIAFTLSAILVNAQMATLKGAGNSVVMRNTYTEIDGSPYLYEEYKTGTVVDIDGNQESSLLLKYNMYEDKVIVFKDNQHLVLNEGIYPEFTFSFYSEENENVVQRFIHAGKLSNPGAKGYYEVLYDGEYKLLRKYDVAFLNKVVSEYGTTSEIKRFVTEDKVFLLSPDARMTELRGGKSGIYDAFIGYSGKVKKIAKKNDLNVKRTEDLISLIEILEREGMF